MSFTRFYIESSSDTGQNYAAAFRKHGMTQFVLGGPEHKAMTTKYPKKDEAQAVLIRSMNILWVRRRKRFPFRYQPNPAGTWVNHIEGECHLTQKNLLALVMQAQLGHGIIYIYISFFSLSYFHALIILYSDAHRLLPESYCVFASVPPTERKTNTKVHMYVSLSPRCLELCFLLLTYY